MAKGVVWMKRPTFDKNGALVFQAMMQTGNILLKRDNLITRREYRMLEKYRKMALKTGFHEHYFDQIVTHKSTRFIVEAALKATKVDDFMELARDTYTDLSDNSSEIEGKLEMLQLGTMQVQRLYDWYKKRGFEHAESW